MPVEITLEEVGDFLRSETDAAMRAALRIPVDAAIEAFAALLEMAPEYSGAYRAACAIGVNELPSIPADLKYITDEERHERARYDDILEPSGPWSDTSRIAAEFDEDDSIIIGNDIRYAHLVEEKFDMLITEQTNNVMLAALQRGIDTFNRRSEASSRRRR